MTKCWERCFKKKKRKKEKIFQGKRYIQWELKP